MTQVGGGSGTRGPDSSEAARRIARILLRLGAVSINSREPFVYTSGVRSPIYTDNRILISYPDERDEIVSAFAQRIREEVGPEGVDVVAGTATAAIPYAAWVAARLHKPLVYVRASAKEHGKGQQIEGHLRPGQRAVVIEDLISTGMSSAHTVDAIRQAGGEVSHCFAIFTYEFQASRDAYEQRGVSLVALTSISTLLDVALAERVIDDADRQAVLEWLDRHRGSSEVASRP